MSINVKKLLRPIAASFLAVALLSGCASNKQKVQSAQAAFWPQYPDPPRLQYLTSFTDSSDAAPPKSKLDELVLGKEQEQVMGLGKPYGLEMWNGRIYVCDLGKACVTIFDVRNSQTLLMGKTGADTLQRPVDIAISPDGYKYVADQGKGRIYIFDPQDRHIGVFAPPNLKPGSIALWQGELYVTDLRGQCVKVFDRYRGNQLRTIGGQGMGDGQFIMPLGLDVDAQGNVYVMDFFKCQLQKFDRQGKLVTRFGQTSANAGGNVKPKQIAVDQEGVIYVVDAAFQNVQLLDQIGRPLTFFGSPGQHPGAMFMPAGITVHEGDLELFQKYVHPAFKPQRLVLVTNQFGNQKVSVYALGQLAEGKSVADVAASQGVVPAGTGDSKICPLPAPTTAPSDEIATAAHRAAATRPAATQPVTNAATEDWQRK